MPASQPASQPSQPSQPASQPSPAQLEASLLNFKFRSTFSIFNLYRSKCSCSRHQIHRLRAWPVAWLRGVSYRGEHQGSHDSTRPFRPGLAKRALVPTSITKPRHATSQVAERREQIGLIGVLWRSHPSIKPRASSIYTGRTA